ncbi:MAG: glycosyl hydrolase family 65 protein [bacterium]
MTALHVPGTEPLVLPSHFEIEPWQVRESSLDLDRLAQSESVFALSNGHVGVRGNLDEGDPYGIPGTYLNSFYEERPLPYAEAGYGYPEEGQTIVNVTNGKIIRLLVDDEPFDMRYGHVRRHERVLDLRAGLLYREVEWISPAGRAIMVRSTRLVSFTQRAILAINFEVEALDGKTRVVLQSELVANEEIPTPSKDPRVAAALESPLVSEEHSVSTTRAVMIHRTRASRLRMAAGMDHVIYGADNVSAHTHGEPDWARTTVGTRLDPGERLGITKFVAYGWSSQRSVPALRDQVDAALSAALHAGWDEIVAEQRDYLDEFWDGADVEVEGDPAIQQAVRFALFHVLQAGARAEQRAITAKGLTGPGYDGHSFWDTELYAMPALTATYPRAAADAVVWRHSIMDLARERADTLNLKGVAFPWRTIRGQECSAYWPAGTAAFHINADIASAAMRLVQWTGDDAFEREHTLPILVETARLWMSLGYHGDDGRFHIDGVTGPDEYTAVVDDNTFTNLMAARNLTYAAQLARRWTKEAAALDITALEPAEWEAAAGAMAVPYDAEREVYQQDRGSTDKEIWNFEKTAERGGYPLLLHSPYFDIYRKQVIKQADLMMAMHWCGDSFTLEEKGRAFAYYEPLTVRDSSLSACTQAIMAAEVGHLDLAHDYLTEAALLDLRDLAGNTRDGVHIAALAGTWLALVAGFGGMRDHGGRLTFAPRLPETLQRLTFAVRWRGTKVRVDIREHEATYSLDDDGSRLELAHHGSEFSLGTDASVTVPIDPMKPVTPRPTQPAGRKPVTALTEDVAVGPPSGPH